MSLITFWASVGLGPASGAGIDDLPTNTALGLKCKQNALPRAWKEGVLQKECDSAVVIVSFDVCNFLEGARGENPRLAGIRPRKPGGLVPVEVVDDIRIFGVGLLIFAGEYLRLHLHPAGPESPNRAAFLALSPYCLCLEFTARARDRLSRSLVDAHGQRDLVRYVRPRQVVNRGRVVGEECLHGRGHEDELVHRFQTETLSDRPRHVDLRVEGAL